MHSSLGCYKKLGNVKLLKAVLLMIQILHDLLYIILPEFLWFWYLKSCRIFIINGRSFVISAEKTYFMPVSSKHCFSGLGGPHNEDLEKRPADGCFCET